MLTIAEMETKHKTSICAHNWKIRATRQGVILEYWESITKPSDAKGIVQASESKNFSKTFGKREVKAQSYFKYNNDFHLLAPDNIWYWIPNNTRYKPGSGKITGIQSMNDVSEIIESKCQNVRSQKG